MNKFFKKATAEFQQRLGYERESFVYNTILKEKYTNVFWCRNYRKVFDLVFKIDFIASHNNEYNGFKTIDLIQVGTAKKDFFDNYNNIRAKVLHSENYLKFLIKFLMKEKVFTYGEKILIYYRFITFWNSSDEILYLTKDYTLYVKKLVVEKEPIKTIDENILEETKKEN